MKVIPGRISGKIVSLAWIPELAAVSVGVGIMAISITRTASLIRGIVKIWTRCISSTCHELGDAWANENILLHLHANTGGPHLELLLWSPMALQMEMHLTNLGQKAWKNYKGTSLLGTLVEKRWEPLP